MDTDQIKRVLNTLDEDEETIKILYFFIQRFNEAQIALRVGPSEGTVRSRLHNISAKMSAGYVLSDEVPGAPLDEKYRFITGEVETVVLDALGRETPDWSKFPFEIAEPDPSPDPDVLPPTPNVTNRLNVAIWGIVAVFFLFGGWRFIQLVVWDCNPFTSNIICPFDQPATGADGNEELAVENQDPLLAPTIDEAAEETRIQALVNDELTSQAPTPVTPDPTGTERAIQTEAAQRVDQILTETAAAIPTETPTNTPTSTITLTPSITPTPSDTPTITPVPPLLFDDFEDGNSNLWTARTSSEWVVEQDDDGQYGMLCLRPGIATFADQGWVDYKVSADVRITAGSGEVGVVARYQEGHYFYVAEITETEARIRLKQFVVAGTGWRTVESVGYTTQPGNVYNIALQVRGIQLIMYVNDEEVINVTNSRFEDGGIGIRCAENTIAIFDNVLVEQR